MARLPARIMGGDMHLPQEARRIGFTSIRWHKEMISIKPVLRAAKPAIVTCAIILIIFVTLYGYLFYGDFRLWSASSRHEYPDFFSSVALNFSYETSLADDSIHFDDIRLDEKQVQEVKNVFEDIGDACFLMTENSRSCDERIRILELGLSFYPTHYTCSNIKETSPEYEHPYQKLKSIILNQGAQTNKLS